MIVRPSSRMAMDRRGDGRMIVYPSPGIAMDRAPSARRVDIDGRLHVTTSHLSKANIRPYIGREIPGWQQLGLDATRVYRLYCPPEELAAAADTFNNIPVLDRHVPVSAWDMASHRPELVVGSTGTDCAFDGTYLDNSLVVWAKRAIDGIRSRRKRQLSAAYRYTPVMEPGSVDGLQFDGKMTKLIGNHIALVIEGRAGPDVVVGDENMKSRKAYMLSGALAAFVAPLLAQDGKLDMTAIGLDDVTADNLPERKAAISAKVVELVTPSLAQDAAIETADVDAVIDAVIDITIAEDAIPDAPKPAPKVKPKPGDVTNVTNVIGLDEATVQTMIDAAKAETRSEMLALDTARRAVFPHVGEVTLTEANAIYKFALDAAKVDLTGIEPSAYPGMVRMLPKPGDKRVIAQDNRPTGTGLAAIVNLQPMKVI